MDLSQPTLIVQDLTVAYRSGNQLYNVVQEFSIQIYPSQIYGLVGESGSGKTTLALAMMGYLGEQAVVRQGRISLMGRELLGLPQQELRALWGRRMALVPQNPLSSLNPSLRIGEQVAEIYHTHAQMDAAAARRQAIALLHEMRLPDAQRIADSYPHQISGGMQQRVLIAMALSSEPDLLVLDEPTTSLDVTTQAGILDLIRELIQGRQTAVLYVTHNLGVVAQLCDRVAVLYAGELVEDGAVNEVFLHPQHPYTAGLLQSIPRLGQTNRAQSLTAIPGQIPALEARPTGCVFKGRCQIAAEVCDERPTLFATSPDHLSRCHRWQLFAETSFISDQEEVPQNQSTLPSNKYLEPEAKASGENGSPAPLLELKDVQVYFPIPRTLGEIFHRQTAQQIRAVDRASLSVSPGMTIGLVGESGSGKSSLARAIVALIEPTGGQIEFLQTVLPVRLGARDLDTLRHMQMVFQNPEEALNPYQTVGETLRRTLKTLIGMNSAQARERADELLEMVRLPRDYNDRMPGQLSGGEKQRVALARAFASNPDLLIADEAVSSLDVSVQASILNLLKSLQAEQGTTILFISHDLSVISYLADLVAVIYLGEIMELCAAPDLLVPPHHPYTEALLSAVPNPGRVAQHAHVRLEGEIPSPINKPGGCPFHTRCPRCVGDICFTQTPPWQEAGMGNRIFCHIPVAELIRLQIPVSEATE